MKLNDSQLTRYSRHITLREFGEESQEKLCNSRVLIIGTGGLGSPAAMYLAAAGIGTIGLCDDDCVDLSNLQRQIIHHTMDVGHLKTESAGNKIKSINPEVNVVVHNTLVSKDNIESIIKDYDFILDCTDNFETRFLINDACVKLRKPFCHGAVIRFIGQVMTYVPDSGPCYRCVFSDVPDETKLQSNKVLGVLGPVAGIIGTTQALECIKYLTGIGELLTGKLFTIDALNLKSRVMVLPTNDECPVCHADKK